MVFCLSVVQLNDKFVNATSPSRRLNMKTILIPLDRESLYLCTRVQVCPYAARCRHHRRLEIENALKFEILPVTDDAVN